MAQQLAGYIVQTASLQRTWLTLRASCYTTETASCDITDTAYVMPAWCYRAHAGCWCHTADTAYVTMCLADAACTMLT